jgi:hypothetical protein
MSDVFNVAKGVKPVGRMDFPERQTSPMGLYSHAAEMAQQHLPNRVSPQQMVGTLLGKGVKPEELHNAGVSHPSDPTGRTLTPEWASRGPLTKDEAAQHFWSSMPKVKENQLGHNQTKYDKHTTPGGENYREVVLHLQKQKNNRDKYNDYVKSLYEKYGHTGFRGIGGLPLTPEEGIEYDRLLNSSNNEKIDDTPPFQSSHFPQPNVLAHVRLSDRTGPNGEKILHVEEIQSDWGQEGREKGFKDIAEREYQSAMKERALASRNVGDTFDKLMSSGISDNDAYNHPDFLRALQNEKDAAKHVGNLNLQMKFGLSTAPHVTSTDSWTDLALKRVLKEAAEGGYDKVVWTPGAEQAGRYSLSNHVDRIAYDPEEKTLSYVPKNNNGRGWTDHPGDVEPKDLAGIIGKDAAERLLAEKPNPLNGIHTLEAPDLSFGGEGMKGYYDKIVPKRMQALVKKHDPEARIGVSNIAVPDEGIKPVHSVDITPKMRESILKGQTAFQRGGSIHPAHAIHGIHILHDVHGEPEFTGVL